LILDFIVQIDLFYEIHDCYNISDVGFLRYSSG